MASTKAICFRCGTVKPSALAACGNCGFEPTSGNDAAKSHILSCAFDIGEDSFGRLMPELMTISDQIKSGIPFAFDAAEVEAVKTAFADADSASPVAGVFSIVRWLFVPGIIALFVILLLISK